MGAPRPHGSQVTDRGGQGGHDGRYVELGVVGQDTDGVAGAELVAPFGDEVVGPGHDDLVGQRKALGGGEGRPGIAHHDPVAEHLGHLDQGGGEVDRAEDPHLGRRGERLDEHRHRVFAGLAVSAIVTYTGVARLELAEGIAGDHPVEVGVAKRAER